MPPFETYKDKTLVQMKIHANQLNLEIGRLREALADCQATLEAFLQIGILNEPQRMIAESTLSRIEIAQKHP